MNEITANLGMDITIDLDNLENSPELTLMEKQGMVQQMIQASLDEYKHLKSSTITLMLVKKDLYKRMESLFPSTGAFPSSSLVVGFRAGNRAHIDIKLPQKVEDWIKNQGEFALSNVEES